MIRLRRRRRTAEVIEVAKEGTAGRRESQRVACERVSQARGASTTARTPEPPGERDAGHAAPHQQCLRK